MSAANNIRHDTDRPGKSTADAVVDTAADLADKAQQKFEQAKSAAGEMASDAVASGREAGRQIDAVASNLKGAVDKSVRDQPMATLAVAALAGFVLGAIWKS